MILLSEIIREFREPLMRRYKGQLLPSHYKALDDMARCRTAQSPLMQAKCDECEHQRFIPHSCGHRHCPHCQHHESQQWLERQLEKSVPAEYFMVTFTLPCQFRPLAWANQRKVYRAMIQCAWETLKQFSQNDRALKGIPGAIMVLHTHARNLDDHPHVHVVIPAAAVDKANGVWRAKQIEGKKRYLFNHKALAIVFRAKLLEALTRAGLALPQPHPKEWIVDCRSVGSGEPALIYLGRYLYRGVIQEKDIVACHDGKVTYRWEDNETGEARYKTVEGETFLWRLLRHVLPKRFRRARNFGFLHPNSQSLRKIIETVIPKTRTPFVRFKKERPELRCPCCGGVMMFVRFRIQPADYRQQLALV